MCHISHGLHARALGRQWRAHDKLTGGKSWKKNETLPKQGGREVGELLGVCCGAARSSPQLSVAPFGVLRVRVTFFSFFFAKPPLLFLIGEMYSVRGSAKNRDCLVTILDPSLLYSTLSKEYLWSAPFKIHLQRSLLTATQPRGRSWEKFRSRRLRRLRRRQGEGGERGQRGVRCHFVLARTCS